MFQLVIGNKEIRNKFKMPVLLALVAMLIAIYFLYSRFHNNISTSQNIPSVLVQVARVEEKPLNLVIEASGTVTPDDSVALKSRLDSQIVDIKFHDGDLVKEGQLLFVLDDSALQAQLRQAEATLIRDKAVMDNLLVQYKRVKIIADKGFESQSDLDNARYQYEAQAATANASQAAVDNIKAQLEYTQIKAPINGRTGTINVTLGNYVKANDTVVLVTINKTAPIMVQFSLPERYLGILRDAMAKNAVDVMIKYGDGNNAILKGKIDHIENTVDKATSSFIVRAAYDNEKEELWPGVFVSLELHIGDKVPVVVVPEVAIQHTQDGDFVFRISQDKAIKNIVKVDRIQQGLAVITSGISPGEQVVVDGVMKLDDGSNVTIINDPNKQSTTQKM